MKRLLTSLPLVLAFLISATSAPAAEKASHQVSPFHGSLSYGIPIEVPAYHGVEPQLALNYSSEGRNGPVGVGWSLTGISTVERVNSGRGTPKFDGHDKFLLDGQELVPCPPNSASPSCTSGGTHSTLVESYLKIRFDPTPNTWTVWGNDGTRTVLSPIYVAPPGPVLPGGTIRWGQTNVIDTVGNAVVYNWTNLDGDVYLSSIVYNGYAVSLFWEPRPDTLSFATSTSLGQTRYRLRSVAVYIYGVAQMRGYALSYATSPLTGRSLLASVQQYGKDLTLDGSGAIIGGTALPPQSFTYQDDALGHTFQSRAAAVTPVSTPEPVEWTRRIHTNPRDLSGVWKVSGQDGAYDAGASSTRALVSGDGYVEFTSTNVDASAAKFFGLSHDDAGTAPQEIDFAFAVNSDGTHVFEKGVFRGTWTAAVGDHLRIEIRQGVVHYLRNGSVLYVSTQTPTYPLVADASIGQMFDLVAEAVLSGSLQSVAGWCTDGTLMTGDFNGDGRTDQLCSTWPPVIRVALATENGFAAPTVWSTGLAPTVLGDFNGDGKTDFAFHHYWTAEVWVALSTGTAFAELQYWGAVEGRRADNTHHACRIDAAIVGAGDFNGDGLTDISCRLVGGADVFIGFSNGASGFSFGISLTGGCDDAYDSSGALDFNGDGKTDWYCIGIENNRMYIYPSNGSIFEGPVYGFLDGSFCPIAKYVLGDFNGDGRTDAACTQNGRVALSTGREFQIQGDFGGWCFEGDAFAADFDGDAVSEIVCNNPGAGADDIQVRRWTAGALRPAETWKAGWCNGRMRAGDFNGDGKTDLHCADQAEPVAVAGTSGLKADFVSSIANGIGGTTQVSYTLSSRFPSQNNPPPKYVIDATTVDDGHGGQATTRYAYAGGLMNWRERRFMGFQYLRQTLPCVEEESACPYVETWLKQDLASAGKPERVVHKDGGGRSLRATDYTYVTNGSGTPYTCQLTAKTEYSFDTTGTPCQTYPCASSKRVLTTYTYDPYGNVTSTSFHGDQDMPNDSTTAVASYFPNATAYIVDRVARQTQYAGIGTGGAMLADTVFMYDGAPSWSQPPSRGLVTSSWRWLDNPVRYVGQRFAYDAWGNRTSDADETGRTTTTTYDTGFHLFPTSVANPAGEVESFEWDPICGAPRQRTNANGQVFTMQTDALCRSTLTAGPLGIFESRSYPNLGDPATQAVVVESPSASAGDGTGNHWTAEYFDGLGRTYLDARKGPTSEQTILRYLGFDARGNVAWQTAPYYAGETAQVTRFEHDPLGRRTRVLFPGGSDVRKTYGLWSETGTDEHGHPSTMRFDAYGRTVVKEQQLSNDTVETRFTYDLLGRRVGMTDDVGSVWSWSFDSLGRNIRKTDPDAGTWTYEFDDAGRMTAQVDAKGQRIAFEYDQAGRLETKTETSATPPKTLMTAVRSEARAGFFNRGELTTVVSPTDVLRLDYDALGRTVRKTRTLDNVTYTLQQRFDPSGRLLGTTFPDGDAVGAPSAPLVHDAAGRLKSIPGTVNEVLYDAAGRPLRQTNANGTVTTRTYTPDRGFLTRIFTQGAGTLQDLNYTLDAAGLASDVTSPVANEGWRYEYDALHRMTSATSTGDPAQNQTFQYDTIGRITFNSRIGTYGYPPAGAPRPHAPLTAGPNSYAYDTNGNLASGGGRTLQWSADNLPVQINQTQFTYDALGSRIKKASSSGTSLYPVGDDYEITNGVVTKYVKADGLGVVAKKVGSQSFWLHTDRLGSVQAVTDASAASVQRRTYRPYGKKIADATSHKESRGYIGEREDTETGLSYLNARYYDSELGLFTSADSLAPWRTGVGPARYSYAGGDPVNWRDPLGTLYIRECVYWREYTIETTVYRECLSDAPGGYDPPNTDNDNGKPGGGRRQEPRPEPTPNPSPSPSPAPTPSPQTPPSPNPDPESTPNEDAPDPSQQGGYGPSMPPPVAQLYRYVHNTYYFSLCMDRLSGVAGGRMGRGAAVGTVTGAAAGAVVGGRFFGGRGAGIGALLGGTAGAIKDGLAGGINGYIDGVAACTVYW